MGVAAVEFKHVDKGNAALQRRLAALRKKCALVGIPSDAERPVDDENQPLGITMADLALIHEKGSDTMRIPARPFMAETRKKYGDATIKFMGSLYRQVVKSMAPARALKLLGQSYEGHMKDIFTEAQFKPNSPITINGGWMRNPKSGKPFKVKGKQSTRPLIDTGRLRGSIVSKVAPL